MEAGLGPGEAGHVDICFFVPFDSSVILGAVWFNFAHESIRFVVLSPCRPIALGIVFNVSSRSHAPCLLSRATCSACLGSRAHYFASTSTCFFFSPVRLLHPSVSPVSSLISSPTLFFHSSCCRFFPHSFPSSFPPVMFSVCSCSVFSPLDEDDSFFAEFVLVRLDPQFSYFCCCPSVFLLFLFLIGSSVFFCWI